MIFTAATSTATSGPTTLAVIVAVVVAVLAAGAAITSAIINVTSNNRGEHRRWIRDARQQAYTALLAGTREIGDAVDDWVKVIDQGATLDEIEAAVGVIREAVRTFIGVRRATALVTSQAVGGAVLELSPREWCKSW